MKTKRPIYPAPEYMFNMPPFDELARATILFFQLAPKRELVEDAEILHPLKYRWISFSRFIGEVKNAKS